MIINCVDSNKKNKFFAQELKIPKKCNDYFQIFIVMSSVNFHYKKILYFAVKKFNCVS